MTKQEYMQRKAEQRKIEKQAKKLASAKTVTKAEYIDKYFSELPKTTTTFTLEIKDRNFGVWALRLPVQDFQMWLKIEGNSKATKIEYSDKMKRVSEAGKPCVKFRQVSLDEAKEMRDLFGYELKRVYPKTHSEMKKLAMALGYKDVGIYFEHAVKIAWNEKHIGELDRQSHMQHADTENDNGEQSECKTYTGWISCQMANEYWKIEG